MVEITVRELDIEIDTSIEETILFENIKRLAFLVDPDLEGRGIEIERLNGGYINCMFKVTSLESGKGAIVVRVFGQARQVFDNKVHEVVVMKAAELGGCGPEVLAAFRNGTVYSYVQGTPMSPSTSDSPRLRSLVAKKIAKFHSIKVEELAVNGEKVPSVSRLAKDIPIVLDAIPTNLGSKELTIHNGCQAFSSRTALANELKWALDQVKDTTCEIVFSHGDLWRGNILYDELADKVHFVDFDTVGIYPFILDLVRYLLCAKLQISPPGADRFSKDDEKDFIKTYLEEKNRLSGSETKGTASDQEVEALYEVFRKYVLVGRTLCMARLSKACTLSEGGESMKSVLKVWADEYMKEKANFTDNTGV